MQESRQYDLVVIGAGPAGIVGAATAAALGRTVALVDSHAELGGAGVNTGTVPSKTLRETALDRACARATCTVWTSRCVAKLPWPIFCVTNAT